MEAHFLIHNLHLESVAHFLRNDQQLRSLKNQTYIYESPLIKLLPIHIPGIYTVGGGRQVGKTTMLKQWMAYLLSKKIPPECIAFFSGELIDDHHRLFQILQNHIATMPKRLHFIIVDEVTYIRDWDKAIKYAADAGLLESTVLVLTGSDMVLIQEARMRFPGRRGKSDKVNFHLYPLSFKETVVLKNKKLPSEQDSAFIPFLFKEWDQYLVHGGYLTAINNLAEKKVISIATLMTYSDWIRGDMLKRGKQEVYLREILGAIIKRYGSQVSWNALAQDLSIDHPATVADYIGLLESMDAVLVQSAILEDKLVGAPKKAKKVFFSDPFVFHAMRYFLGNVKNPFEEQILPLLKDPIWHSKLTEACVVAHFKRRYPTYYIKAEGEVDVAYVKDKRFWPIEIKWTEQLHAKNLKQVLKYKNAKIFTHQEKPGNLQYLSTIPLPLALWELPEEELEVF